MAHFKQGKGSLFDSDAETLVNPVNCRGTMGKGLALQFARRYPAVEETYKRDCAQGLVEPGKTRLYRTDTPVTVANLPTKDDWRQRSRIQWVRSGLSSLAEAMAKERLTSVAVPAVGAGLGGLSWKEVETAIYEILNDTDLTVTIYPPYRESGRR